MSNSRRNFLKLSGLAGIGLVAKQTIARASGQQPVAATFPFNPSSFNMSGYAAPALDTVRIGFIGLGNRGPYAVNRMKRIEGTRINALCDIRSEKAEAAKKTLEGSVHQPVIYSGKEEAWKKLCSSPDIDLVYIATPWSLHTPIAIYAMKQGKHVCIEVPAAKTIDECWELVETSEQTKKHCMILENCCYDYFELLTLNLVRQGYFGEIVHAEGAYIHDLLEGNFSKEKYYNMWRLKENLRNGNLYPTHGLGPIAQAMNLNRGDKADFIVSVSGNDFMMHQMAEELAKKDDFYKDYTGKKFRGNMNTSVLRTHKGRTIMLQHDVTSPNIYSRIHKISGTRGSALKYPLPGKIATGHTGWLTEEQQTVLTKESSPPILQKLGETAKEIGGHGGMDFLMDWRTIDCLRNGLPLDIDVYDAALWSAISPLSERSVASNSAPVVIPDFTKGRWKTNKPVDLSLDKGGNTKVLDTK